VALNKKSYYLVGALVLGLDEKHSGSGSFANEAKRGTPTYIPIEFGLRLVSFEVTESPSVVQFEGPS
jgi:hypothetical protein